MNEKPLSSGLTSSDRMTAALLRWAPWLAFLLVALPLPLYFLRQYFTVPEGAGEYMLLALTSLAAGSLVGLVVVALLMLYRRSWEKRLRERLARDGVTANELPWFMSELSAAERRALKQMEAQSPLLADAYRETLAARVTAARVLSSATREHTAVLRRLQSASRLRGSNRAELERDLQADRARLERVTREAREHYAEIETRAHMIEAMASRGASEEETERALQRLGSARQNEPLGLASARLEQEARTQAQHELRELEQPRNTETPGT